MVFWEIIPSNGCSLTNDGLTVNRVQDSLPIPDFSVALTGPLDGGDRHELQVLYTGDCNYFGVGIAESNIPTDESPRRLQRGSAWFLLNKGFLCDGGSFEDDSLDPVGPNQRIILSFDRSRSRLTVRSNNTTIGIVNKVDGQDLRFFCYLDGSNAMCSIVDEIGQPLEATHLAGEEAPDVVAAPPAVVEAVDAVEASSHRQPEAAPQVSPEALVPETAPHVTPMAVRPEGAPQPIPEVVPSARPETAPLGRLAGATNKEVSLPDRGFALFERRRLALASPNPSPSEKVKPSTDQLDSAPTTRGAALSSGPHPAPTDIQPKVVLKEPQPVMVPTSNASATHWPVVESRVGIVGVGNRNVSGTGKETRGVEHMAPSSGVVSPSIVYLPPQQMEAVGPDAHQVEAQRPVADGASAERPSSGKPLAATQTSSMTGASGVTSSSATRRSTQSPHTSRSGTLPGHHRRSTRTPPRPNQQSSGEKPRSSQLTSNSYQADEQGNNSNLRQRPIASRQSRSTPQREKSGMSKPRVQLRHAATQVDEEFALSDKMRQEEDESRELDREASDEVRMTHLILDDLLSQLPNGVVQDIDTRKVEEILPTALSKVTYHLLHRLWEEVRIITAERMVHMERSSGKLQDSVYEPEAMSTSASKTEIERISAELASSERERWSLSAELTRMSGKVSAMEQNIISLQRQIHHKSETLKSMLSLDKSREEWDVVNVEAVGDTFGLHIETPRGKESSGSREFDPSGTRGVSGSPPSVWGTPMSREGTIFSPHAETVGEGSESVAKKAALARERLGLGISGSAQFSGFNSRTDQERTGEFGLASTPQGGNSPRLGPGDDFLGLVPSLPGSRGEWETSSRDESQSSREVRKDDGQLWRVISIQDARKKEVVDADSGQPQNGAEGNHGVSNNSNLVTRTVELSSLPRTPPTSQSVFYKNVGDGNKGISPLLSAMSSPPSTRRSASQSPKDSSGRRVVSVVNGGGDVSIESYGALC